MNARRLYNGEYAVTDVCGRDHIVSKDMWIVTSVDKMMSGWGTAEGKINKRIVICKDWRQASKVADNMRKGGFIYVGCRSVEYCGIPYYQPKRYVVSFHHADDCPVWNK